MVMCVGWNNEGQLGLGDITGRLNATPVNIVSMCNIKSFDGVNCFGPFYESLCALTNDGACYCLGYSGQGQLGDGTNSNKYTSIVPVSGSHKFKKIKAAYPMGCAIVEDFQALAYFSISAQEP